MSKVLASLPVGQRVGIAGRAVTYSMGYLQVTAQYP